IENLSKSNADGLLFKNVNINVAKGDKIAFIAKNHLAITALFGVAVVPEGAILRDANGTVEPFLRGIVAVLFISFLVIG
ncbi:UNVERIFIED_CONTAM: AbgT family transporter, partial [Salmonella enterica subsp. enterica serovar Weltevreden]